MAEFLSAEWVEAYRQACPPIDESLSVVVQNLVNGGPDGNVAYTTTYENGQATAAALTPAPAKGDDGPAATLQLSYDDAQRVADGDLELGVAFMQGRLKAEGDMKTIISLLHAAHTSRL